MLTYNPTSENYSWGCVRCQVYKLPFSPDAAGKQSKHYADMEEEGLIPQWKLSIVSYPNNIVVVETEINKGTPLFPETYKQVSFRKE